MRDFNLGKDNDAFIGWAAAELKRNVDKIKVDKAAFVKSAAIELGLSVNNVSMGIDKMSINVSGDQDKIDILNTMVADEFGGGA